MIETMISTIRKAAAANRDLRQDFLFQIGHVLHGPGHELLLLEAK